MPNSPRAKSTRVFVVGAASLACAIGIVQFSKRDTTGSMPGVAKAATSAQRVKGAKAEIPEGGHLLTAIEAETCEGEAVGVRSSREGNPKARKAAQSGLQYLAKAAADWQKTNNCYGCHVQAVTLKALSIGRHHQYDVGQEDIDTILHGMFELGGGVNSSTGLGYHSPGEIHRGGKVFGVSAFARYDQLVSEKLEDTLLKEAEAIASYQDSTGAIAINYVNPPVSTGVVQFTAEAIVAWRQAFERSADPKWNPYMSKAEDYLRGVVHTWKETPTSSLQEINYAVLGLLSAGVGGEEETLQRVAKLLRSRQNTDGGWSLTAGGASEAFATGQALYTLRSLGANDDDDAVAKGTSWLIEHQIDGGAWSASGFGKAEAMWGVLGLVSLDVLSIAVDGVKDGTRVEGLSTIKAIADDNGGSGVRHVEIRVDDILVANQCGTTIDYKLDASKLADGKHIIDIRASNREGRVSRRSFEVYAGDVYITQLGSSFEQGNTVFSMRDIATGKDDHAVELEVRDASGALVQTLRRDGSTGSLNLSWDGLSNKGEAQQGGKYEARIAVKDKSGKVLQSEVMSFVHDTEEAQRAGFSQIVGSIALPGAAPARNVAVELIDAEGNVVERTKSTSKGRYRFKNVDGDRKYKVRVLKDGFAGEAAEVAADEGGEVKADLELK